MSELINKLMTLPTAQLEAIYNAAWRNRHNDIKTEMHNTVLVAIEFVAGSRQITISGRGGAWEFVSRGQHDCLGL